jgi:hypothetical protein
MSSHPHSPLHWIGRYNLSEKLTYRYMVLTNSSVEKSYSRNENKIPTGRTKVPPGSLEAAASDFFRFLCALEHVGPPQLEEVVCIRVELDPVLAILPTIYASQSQISYGGFGLLMEDTVNIFPERTVPSHLLRYLEKFPFATVSLPDLVLAGPGRYGSILNLC